MFFVCPVEIRKIIYTANIIEGLNHQSRQTTKNKPFFTHGDSLRRMRYLASQRIVKHRHARCRNWDLVLSQMELMYAGRAAGGLSCPSMPQWLEWHSCRAGVHTALAAGASGN